MKSKRICTALDTVSPTAAQKDRMRRALEARLPRENTPVVGRYQAKAPRRRPWAWVPAAAMLALALAGGFFLLTRIPQDVALAPPETTAPVETTLPTTQDDSENFWQSPVYQAAAEWQDYLVEQGAWNDPSVRGGSVAPYGMQRIDWDMADQMDELCQRYGLTQQVDETGGTDSLDYALEELGLTRLFLDLPGVESGFAYGSGAWGYTDGSMYFCLGTTMGYDGSPWTDTVYYRLYVMKKQTLFPCVLNLAALEEYEYGMYLTASGTTVLLGLNEDDAFLFKAGEEWNIYADIGDWFQEESTHGITMEALEALAEVLDLAQFSGHTHLPPSDTQETTTAPTEVTQETLPTVWSWQDTPEHRAFQAALRTIREELRFPELPDAGRIELWEPGTIDQEMFAVVDVDQDGQEELLVSISNTYTAGMREVIYGYDPQTGGVRVEAQNYLGIDHYPGILKVDASHNHGYAGDVLWPYVVMVYDEAQDLYTDVYSVDAWSRELAEYDAYREMYYPEDIDTEGVGHVYLITENGELHILSQADYQAWEEALFGQLQPVGIPWQNMFAENCGLEVEGAEDTASTEQDEL